MSETGALLVSMTEKISLLETKVAALREENEEYKRRAEIDWQEIESLRNDCLKLIKENKELRQALSEKSDGK